MLNEKSHPCFKCGNATPKVGRMALGQGVAGTFFVSCPICLNNQTKNYADANDAGIEWNKNNPVMHELSTTELHDTKAMGRSDVTKALLSNARATLAQGKSVALVLPYDEPRKGRLVQEVIETPERLEEIAKAYE